MEDVKATSEKGTATASTIVLAIDVIGLLVLGGVTLSAKRAFAKMFADMKVELPAVTNTILSIPTAAYVGVFLSLIVVLILKEILIRAGTVKLVINLAAIVGGIVYLSVYIIALFLPLIELMTQVS